MDCEDPNDLAIHDEPPWLDMLAVLAPLLLLFAWVAFRSGPLAPINVTVTQVEERSISPAMFGIGTVEARYTQKVGPTAAGRVTLVAVDVGDKVVAGQLLAQIDPIDLDQRIDAAAGGTARSAALEQAAVAQIADANARVVLARSVAARTEELKRVAGSPMRWLINAVRNWPLLRQGLRRRRPIAVLLQWIAGVWARNDRRWSSSAPICGLSHRTQDWWCAALWNPARPWWPARL
jgi:hypothetical protein